jgi:Arc/MetJ-type ribon-helix-helix transcriptional regulator
MSNVTRKEQARYQVVSDLGQLKVFTKPLQVGILRILQHQEASIDQLVEMVGETKETVFTNVRELVRLGLLELVEREEDSGDNYRAKARIFHLHPDRGHERSVSATITPATIAAGTAESIGKELGASLTAWPDQMMNFEARRVRMSYAQAREFNEKLVDLVHEYWGGPDQSVDEDPNDPVMSFVGLWYRFPEKL